MRITIAVPAVALVGGTSSPVQDTDWLNQMNNAYYSGDKLYKYLSIELAELGVIGGDIHCVYDEVTGLVLQVDYWVHVELSAENLLAVLKDTQGQLSDGMGEQGARFEVAGHQFDLVARYQQATITQWEDGTAVPAAPRVAISARHGDLSSLRSAIEQGTGPDETLQGNPALHLSILYGHTDVATYLIRMRANPNLKTPDGSSALHLCALTRELSDEDSATIAELLICFGGDVSAVDGDGDSIIQLAESRHKAKLIKVLKNQKRRKQERS